MKRTVLARLLWMSARPAFGPCLQLIGANRAYEPSALAIIAFVITWASMGVIQIFGSVRALSRQKI